MIKSGLTKKGLTIRIETKNYSISEIFFFEKSLQRMICARNSARI